MLCEKCVQEALEKLRRNTSGLNVKKCKEFLCAAWNAHDVEFIDDRGAPLHGRKLVSNAVQQPLTVRVVYELAYHPTVEKGSVNTTDLADDWRDGESVRLSCEEPSAFPADAQTRLPARRIDPIVERAIRALDAQERCRDFIWAGFVVNDLLPNSGAEKRESQVIFERMKEEGLILVTRVPNPKNPAFQTARVQLNQENETVRRVLKNGRSSPVKLPLGRVEGELLSDRIVRERR